MIPSIHPRLRPPLAAVVGAAVVLAMAAAAWGDPAEADEYVPSRNRLAGSYFNEEKTSPLEVMDTVLLSLGVGFAVAGFAGAWHRTRVARSPTARRAALMRRLPPLDARRALGRFPSDA